MKSLGFARLRSRTGARQAGGRTLVLASAQRFFEGMVLLAALVLAAHSAWAGDIGVSVQIAEPGVFGRIDIGRYGPPQVILQAPIVAEPPAIPPPVAPEPLYLWVPPEHQEHWREHCREYHACGHPVYFVHHDWYREHVMNERRHAEGEGRGEGRGERREREEHGERGHEEHGERGRERDDHERDRSRD